jgi:hypothetical protein
MAHDAHAAAHDSHDNHDSHGAHGHAAVADDGTAGGPIGWPLALIVGIGYLVGALSAFMAH